MKMVYNVLKHNKKIKNSIKKYGYFAEHNYLHYMHSENSKFRNVFFDCGRDKGILMQDNEKDRIWSLFPCGVLAPAEERTGLLIDAARYVLLKKKAKKLVVEVSEEMRKDMLEKLKKQNRLRACAYNYILYWPVYNMKLWDPRLRGSRMKKLRNIRNRFYKKNRVKLRDSRDVPKEQLKKIFSNWIRRRYQNDHIDKSYYLNLIDDNFKGTYAAKTLYVNGKPATITAGWKIPNSNSYYSAIGIVDYSYPGLGEIANIDDLNRLKRKGFRYVDFGGSDKVLLRFKRKFKPESIYKTYVFSIVRK